MLLGLAILSSLSIPNILGRIKLNRVEEAKALMNSYALDCLSKYRISTNTADFIENETPDELDNVRLSTLQYQIDGDKNKCAHVAIKPLNENEKDLFAFDFRMSTNGLILKTAIPSDNPKFLNSCRSWAGKNCGLSAEQEAEFARLAALAKAEADCNNKYSLWLSNKGSGKYEAWDKDKEDCVRPVFAFEGVPVNSQEAVDAAETAMYGKVCLEWRTGLRDDNYISEGGNGKTKKECKRQGKPVYYWFHSGQEFTSQVKWNEFDNEVKVQACNTNRNNALYGENGVKQVNGPYTYVPSGPAPCGSGVWFCNGIEYDTEAAYKTTDCGKGPIPGDPDYVSDYCKYVFRPHPFCDKRKPVGPNCVCES